MATVISASKLMELLRSADAKNELYVSILTAARLGLGKDPGRPELVVDLSEERIIPYNRPEGSSSGTQPQMPNGTATRSPRRSGNYWLEIEGMRSKYRSLKEVLAEGLRTLEQFSPGTLEKLSDVKNRSRRIVARHRDELFDKPHLREKYAERLIPGWWYGTNNSGEQVEVWLKRASTLAGLEWGKDFRIGIADQKVEVLDW